MSDVLKTAAGIVVAALVIHWLQKPKGPCGCKDAPSAPVARDPNASPFPAVAAASSPASFSAPYPAAAATCG